MLNLMRRMGLGLGFSKTTGGSPPPPTNLLAALPWVQGAATTLSIAGGRARATATTIPTPPRIWKQVDGLTIGASYRYTCQVRKGTQSGDIYSRLSNNTGIPDAIPNGTNNSVNDFSVDKVFVASATTMYIGIVVVNNAIGQYGEIEDTVSLTAV